MKNDKPLAERLEGKGAADSAANFEITGPYATYTDSQGTRIVGGRIESAPLDIRHESQQSICEWATATFGATIDLPRWYARLMEEIGELGEAILDEDMEQIAKEAADSVIMLTRIIGATGFDLGKLVNLKMAVNRAAEWNHKNGVGHRKSRGTESTAPSNPPYHRWNP